MPVIYFPLAGLAGYVAGRLSDTSPIVKGLTYAAAVAAIYYVYKKAR